MATHKAHLGNSDDRAADGKVSGTETVLQRSGFYPSHKDFYGLRFSASGKMLKEGAMGNVSGATPASGKRSSLSLKQQSFPKNTKRAG